jgi:hypothetical protein
MASAVVLTWLLLSGKEVGSGLIAGKAGYSARAASGRRFGCPGFDAKSNQPGVPAQMANTVLTRLICTCSPDILQPQICDSALKWLDFPM